MKPLLARPSLRLFVLIGFGLPWIGWSIIAITGMGPSPLRKALFYTGVFVTVAGLVATYRAGGGPALRLLLRRCLVGGRIGWWLFAVLLPLAWCLLARVAWGLGHGGVGRLDLAGLGEFLAPGALLAFTTGPLGEEAGWRGYLLPRLLGRFSPMVANLILGVAWGVWHVPLYVRSIFSEVGSGAAFLVSVIAFTVLMTVLFHRTRGSLLLAILFHWSVNVAPGVANAMLPSVQVDAVQLRLFEMTALLLATAVVVAMTGRAKLGATEDFDPGRDLAGEAVASDRAAS
jgi:membrane protease YdiL (CAAX protease family)